MKSERYKVYGILDVYFLLYSIFDRLSDNQLVFRWIQSSFFDLPVDQHSIFEIRYSKFEIRNSVSRLLKIRNSIPNSFFYIRRPLLSSTVPPLYEGLKGTIMNKQLNISKDVILKYMIYNNSMSFAISVSYIYKNNIMTMQ